MRQKKPSSLSQEEINIFETMEMVLQDTDEAFSQSCMRYGDMDDKDLFIPMQVALVAFSEDNPKLNANEFSTWYQGLIDDQELFRLNKPTLDLLKEVRILFDEKTKDWQEKGLLNPNYDTSYAYWGIIGMALYSIYHKLREKYDQLSSNAFYKNPMFGKYKIIALDYADDCTLSEFDNPHAYDRFDVEAILFYVMVEVMGGYDSYKEYQLTLELFQEVKDIVYEAPRRLLSDTKMELEERAKYFKEKKLPYAFFYAAVVIDYWLKKQERKECCEQ